MLETVDVGTQGIDGYAESAGPDSVDRLRELAAALRGARVLHVNATPYGGGVAVVDLLEAKVVATIATGAGPNGISFSALAPAPAPAPELKLTLPEHSDDQTATAKH